MNCSYHKLAATLLATLSCFTSNHRNTNADETLQEVTIGAWNIEWLGYPEMRSRPGKDKAQKIEDLVEEIHKSDVSVLSLEEIGVDSIKTLKSKQIDQVVDQLAKKHDQNWQYVLFPKSDYPAGTEDFIVRGQHIGLAWRTDVASMVGKPFAVNTGVNKTYGNKFWERKANAVKLSFGQGKTDIVFIPVHLKSNRNENVSDPDWTKKHRAAETAVLAAELANLKKALQDEDIVVLGDTNFLADDNLGSDNLVKVGFRDLNASDEGTTANWGEGYSSAPFDRIFVPLDQMEFKASVLKVQRPGTTDDEIRNYRRTFSDHYLVTCKVQITNDDD